MTKRGPMKVFTEDCAEGSTAAEERKNHGRKLGYLSREKSQKGACESDDFGAINQSNNQTVNKLTINLRQRAIGALHREDFIGHLKKQSCLSNRTTNKRSRL